MGRWGELEYGYLMDGLGRRVEGRVVRMRRDVREKWRMRISKWDYIL
jgi:hypothetical protein